MEVIAKIVGADEYGPIIEWQTHWSKLVGKELVLAAQPIDAEPVSDLEALRDDITAIDTWHRGSPTYERGAPWMKDQVVRLIDERIASAPPSKPVDAEPVATKQDRPVCVRMREAFDAWDNEQELFDFQESETEGNALVIFGAGYRAALDKDSK